MHAGNQFYLPCWQSAFFNCVWFLHSSHSPVNWLHIAQVGFIVLSQATKWGKENFVNN